MKTDAPIYMSTVALDPTRWGRREPSFDVSEWLPRFEADGFDGVELWEYHYQLADPTEQARLAAAAESIFVYNAYVGFGDDEAESRAKAAEAIRQLCPTAVKYNLGGDADRLDEYRRNLLAWADILPASCRLWKMRASSSSLSMTRPTSIPTTCQSISRCSCGPWSTRDEDTSA